MPEPGAPHTPTKAPRTRPEAEENALKGRATNDWFRHDGKNVEAPPAGHVRLASKQAQEIAAKLGGESDNWFAANGQNGNGHQNGNSTTPPKRCTSAEAQHIRDKVSGQEEDWYKHEENQNYVSPRPKSRLTSQVAQNMKDNMVRDSTDWYKHDGHGSPPEQTGSAKKNKQRTPTPQERENAHKLRPTGLPIWANYSPEKDAVDGSPSRPGSRLKTPDAQEYLKREKGSASDWFSHSGTHVDPNPLSPRLATPEAADNASRQRTKANWFSHDDNKNYVEPVKGPRCTTAAAKEMRERQRGQLGSHFHQNGTGNGVSPHNRIKPEAEDYAKKSVQGMMQKFMDQGANQNYDSPRPGPRVRPEAEDFAVKNKGVMDDCMGGYLDAPNHHNQRRIRPEAEQYANRNRGTTSKVMNGEVAPSARPAARVRPEAQANANRNNASALSQMMSSYGQLEISGRPAPRNVSHEAQQNAQRFQGTAASVMYNRP